jgi:hypothetical protein
MADERPVKSPANKWVRTGIAGGFVVIWLLAILVDFFTDPTTQVVPLWFQMTGLIVLGYLLGITLDDITSGFGK